MFPDNNKEGILEVKKRIILSNFMVNSKYEYCTSFT